MKPDYTFRIRKLSDCGDVALTVKMNIRELAWRVKIGLWLIRLGAGVIGMDVELDVDDRTPPIEKPIEAGTP
jgi:hypothetical protein